MPAADNLADLSRARTARALTKPTTAGDAWATRHGMPTDPYPGARQVTEADVLALRRENAALVRLAAGIDAL